jgi:glycosyltransferase involved in cell wall biosynthesis
VTVTPAEGAASDPPPHDSEVARGPTPAPEITVIVGAYRRQHYLVGAVQSVLKQTIDRSRYEIVVIKNFRTEAIDRFLEEHGVRCLFVDEPRIGRWVMNAIRAARAPLIAFLDDDDLFEPGRLERVLQVFRERPRTGFYHSRVIPMTVAGALVPRERWWPGHVDARMDALGSFGVTSADRERRFPDLVGTSAGFHSSALVVRRELLTTPPGDRFDDIWRAYDLFPFIAAILSPFDMFLDAERQIRYRCVYQVGDEPDLADLSIQDMRLMVDLATRAGCAYVATWIRARIEYFQKLICIERVDQAILHGSERRDVVAEAGRYLRFLGTHPQQGTWDLSTWGGVASAATYLVAPGAVRNFRAARIRAIRAKWRAQGFDPQSPRTSTPSR